jgi:hypothetical protein
VTWKFKFFNVVQCSREADLNQNKERYKWLNRTQKRNKTFSCTLSSTVWFLASIVSVSSLTDIRAPRLCNNAHKNCNIVNIKLISNHSSWNFLKFTAWRVVWNILKTIASGYHRLASIKKLWNGLVSPWKKNCIIQKSEILVTCL